jgi:hypothetical protein
MNPTSYLFDQRDGLYRLYLGGLTTVDGLRLFPSTTVVSQRKLYTDADASAYFPPQTGTIADTIEHLSAIPKHIGLVDFSCSIAGEVEFSTHDDCECHFEAPDLTQIQNLIDALPVTDRKIGLADILKSHPGCYIVLDGVGSFFAYPDFDSLLASQNGG